MSNPSLKQKRKTVKAWAIVNESGLTWGDVEPVNGEYGSGLACPNICTNYKWIKNWHRDEGEKIIPVTISFSIK